MTHELLSFQEEAKQSAIATLVPDVPVIPQRRRQFITVNQRVINMGMDIKFEEDPFNATLYGIMTGDDYKETVEAINVSLHSCRSTALDFGLLMAGPAMLPLIPWAIRSKKHKKLRRRIMVDVVSDFNRSHPHLFMRWTTKPIKSLTIWKREDADAEMNS